ncbi:hypothetical protein FEM03_04155 [Phragmitibacter flavus]|uniref:Membrane transport protein MMPL domain-containing protein n=1 Tax=Phragmitibacter flavus TaxID=2576071 RepID=A0A5R8KJ06_9BACT|nr:MMPL family transporter [Phragmitibacter flavus]TLD71925.1 hypothetical protein FEM03_04155 [Phragmitibacter flavus]
MALWKKLLLAGLLLAVVVGAGLSRLRLETDILATLPAELPEVGGLKLLRDAFDGGDDLVIGLEFADAGLAEESMGRLGLHLQTMKGVERVRSAGTFENPEQAGALLAWSLQNGSVERLGAVRERIEGEKVGLYLQEVLERLAGSPDPAEVQRWSYDPLGLLEGLKMEEMASMEDSGFVLASADGAFRVMFVAAEGGVTGYKEAGAWLEGIKVEVAEWLKREGVEAEVFYTGEPAFMAETGSGIEKDMRGTIGATEVLITLLFWVMFRRLVPLLWIQLLLVVVMLLTLSLASLVLGRLSVMSLGFAAIVLGIVVDYAVLILQKSRDHPEMGARDLRRLAAPGIVAGAGTTSVVFLSLLFSGLPGLGELGIMVALGVVTGLLVMVLVMPELVAGREKGRGVKDFGSQKVRHGMAGIVTCLLVTGVTGVLMWKGIPGYATGAEALRPTQSDAMSGWEVVQQRLGKEDRASVPLLVSGTVESIRSRAEETVALLDGLKGEGVLVGHGVPSVLLPDLQAQEGNRSAIEWLVGERERLKASVLEAGFTEESLALFDQVTAGWERDLKGVWPQRMAVGAAAEVVGKVIAPTEDGVVMLGSVTVEGEPGKPDMRRLAEVSERLKAKGFVHLTGWESLGTALAGLVKRDFLRMTLPLAALLAVMLWITFRNWRDMVLSVAVLGLGIAGLMATMALMGVSWNLASLAALPLLMGTGIDYGIHIMLSMAHEKDDVRKVQSTTGKAVFFSGMTTVIGFGSLVFAGNAGIASLGLACCVGTLWILALVLGLLPYWRAWLGRLGG